MGTREEMLIDSVEYKKGHNRWMVITIIVLAILLIVAVAAVIGLAVALGVSESDDDCSRQDEDSEVCQTENCVELANLVLIGLDPSVDPCEDFYNFTCGAWVENTVIPEGTCLTLAAYVYPLYPSI